MTGYLTYINARHHSIYIGDYKIIAKTPEGINIVDVFQYKIKTFELVHKGN